MDKNRLPAAANVFNAGCAGLQEGFMDSGTTLLLFWT
jgi:hypothetical protein